MYIYIYIYIYIHIYRPNLMVADGSNYSKGTNARCHSRCQIKAAVAQQLCPFGSIHTGVATKRARRAAACRGTPLPVNP